MILNKKIIALGVFLFSATTLTTTVKADITTQTEPTATSTNASDTQTGSVATTSSQTTNENTNNSTNSTQATPSSNTTSPSTNQTAAGTDTNATSTTATSPAKTSPPTTSSASSTSTISTVTTPTSPVTAPTDDTPLTITDPLLEKVFKQTLNIPDSGNITASDIKNYQGGTFNASVIKYLATTSGTSMNVTQTTPIESLNGMQYLQMLPANTKVYFQAKLASDANSDQDLTPLDNLNFSYFNLTGNFNNYSQKEIDVSQLTKLNVQNATVVALNGNLDVSYNSGINDPQLAEIGPWLVNYANSATSANIQLGNSAITDLTPLKGTETGNNVSIIAENNVNYIKTPIYAVSNQPIAITASPVLGLDGDDLASGYHFSNSVPQQYLTTDNLTNLGNDKYILEHPDPTAQVISYGYVGFGYGSDPNNFVNKNYGNANLNYFILNGQPVIWQAHPNVTINYLDTDQQPIIEDGTPLVKTINGVNIGDAYDLTDDALVPGYELASSPELLTGNYTQNPQVVNLIFSPIEIQNEEPIESPITTPPATETNNSNLIPVYDSSGKLVTGSKVNATNANILSTMRQDKQTFYQLNTGQWVKASDYFAQQNPENVVRTFGADTRLVDQNDKTISIKLVPNSEWNHFKIVTMNGQQFYEVANNEYLAVDSAVFFTPLINEQAIHLTQTSQVYNSKGQTINIAFSPNSEWFCDGFAKIDGTLMYRIGNDEWIKESNLYSYKSVKTVIKLTKKAVVYNEFGQKLSLTLPSDSAWKVDQVATINGVNYYRVATNKFIKVD
ncbi:SLAP domain-containing protein [Companilactobacillus halodurans]|uniref:S-layer protein C-terminal domain-containing protein n=1 Tax=Companilactobacillus halodurans TaxID=2584183 RepID=A0A5P0ZUH8_9LACO|nr:SLAP domain-containing protein [Companilactobacillus halodurans]MQS75821.1 hypothetical protein [Companilactobacillus halodurans]MQS96687.1 hypothetical protein [Companilactobacillus halodurans]